MKLIYQWVKGFKNNLYNALKHFESGYLRSTEALKMTGRKNDNDLEVPANKKLCTEENKVEAAEETVKKKIKIRRAAILLSYLGDNYFGIQRNTTFKTIEGELLAALHKANLISATEEKEPYLVQFQITARTDKGVSAAKQVVSLKMGDNYCVETINKNLPDDIKVLSIKRVTKGFYCQRECSARTYSYTLPTFALSQSKLTGYPKNYRIDEETLLKVNDILLSYTGTHNFHNFTSKKQFNDPSARRFIMNFKAGEPFVEGEEFITLTVKGQSFMLHQIRKMVGHMIASLKGIAPPNMQNDIWSEKKYKIPKAPGLGLILEDVHFDRYNKKYKNDGIHESLDWNEVESEVKQFRSKILSNIIKSEIEKKLMLDWIIHLQENHSYIIEEEEEEEEEDRCTDIDRDQFLEKDLTLENTK